MTIPERLIAMRRQFTRERAFRERKGCQQTDAAYWTFNALCFDWYLVPSDYAIASFKFAERIHQCKP